MDHINPASWEGDVNVASMQLGSAWRAGQHLVKHDKDLEDFHPVQKFQSLESQAGADLLNPFGLVVYEECEDEGEELTQSQENPIQSGTSTFELLDLVDDECACCNGLNSTIELPDGKHVHKSRILCEFTKYSTESNSTDHLRRVANVPKFAQSAPIEACGVGDGSVTKMQHILIQDPVAMII